MQPATAERGQLCKFNEARNLSAAGPLIPMVE
jgi:hypothetical protein